MMFLEGASELTTFWQSVRMIKSGRGAGLAKGGSGGGLTIGILGAFGGSFKLPHQLFNVIVYGVCKTEGDAMGPLAVSLYRLLYVE